jgi:hypothetical protein
VSHLVVYLRGQQLIVVPQVGGGGVWRDADALLVAPDGAALAGALKVAFASAATPKSPPTTDASSSRPHAVPCLCASCLTWESARPAEPKPKWIVAERLGLRSAKSFYEDVSMCSVHTEEPQFVVQRWRPARHGRGFEPDSEPPARVEADSLAEVVLETLRKSPRFAPKSSTP